MLFANRKEAGQKLADKLEECFSQSSILKSSDLVVVGLPRGGVPVALEVARRFRCPLEIVVSKKLPFPGQPEYAIGAVSSDDVLMLNTDIPQEPRWQRYIEEQHSRLLDYARTVEGQFYEAAGYQPSSFKGKTVIVIDDGIATGMTAVAALESARLRGASNTILATPVISKQSHEELSQYCNAVVAVSVPAQFAAVGQHYADFTQTSNAEVVQAMIESLNFSRPLTQPSLNNHIDFRPSLQTEV